MVYECRNQGCSVRTRDSGVECLLCKRDRCDMCGCGEMNCGDRKCDEEACGNILYSMIDRELKNCHACRDGIPSIVREEDDA